MRPPYPKVHLLDVADPLLCFVSLTARCGARIEQARCVFMVSGQVSDEMELPRATCPDCRDMVPAGDELRHYVYGIADEAKIRAYDEWREAAS